jgi:S1-C subfamily serine protease
MPETINPLASLADSTAELVERAARSVVAVHSGGRRPVSGIHWRSGIVVTAEEVLERDENIKLALPGGRLVEASLAGRDPTTGVAVLRFQPDGLPVAATTSATLRAGETVLAVGNYDGSPLAALGIVALAGGPWHSARGGTIDNFIRLDLALSPLGEGGALVNARGQLVAMTVLGPRHRAIAIPASTIERSVDQLLARGQVFRLSWRRSSADWARTRIARRGRIGGGALRSSCQHRSRGTVPARRAAARRHRHCLEWQADRARPRSHAVAWPGERRHHRRSQLDARWRPCGA